MIRKRRKRRSRVQSLLFRRDLYSARDSVKWAEWNGFRTPKIETTENYHRIRQDDPENYNRKSFRTIKFKRGLLAVVGIPKPGR